MRNGPLAKQTKHWVTWRCDECGTVAQIRYEDPDGDMDGHDPPRPSCICGAEFARVVRPFSTGTGYMDWCERNCVRCAKASPDADSCEEITCDIERALSEAACGEGYVPYAIAVRMGATKPSGWRELFPRRCTERALNR